MPVVPILFNIALEFAVALCLNRHIERIKIKNLEVKISLYADDGSLFFENPIAVCDIFVRFITRVWLGSRL